MAFKFNATKAVREKIFVKLALMGSSGCVDADTEFFNGLEWKKISDYQKGEKVLEYDKSGNAILSYPLEYHKIPCDKLWHFKAKYGIDQCLSDEHDVLYVTSEGSLAKKKFLDIKNLHENSTCGFTGKFITTFNYSGDGIDLSDEEIELMCAVICNGTFQNEGTRCKFRIEKDEKKKRLVDIFVKCKLDYTTHENTYEGYTDFYVNVPRNEKEFTGYWYNCDKHQLGIVCENVLFWNGNINITKNGSAKKTFSTNSKQTADFVQFAFSSCGMRATIGVNNRIEKVYTSNEKKCIKKSTKYVVGISSNNLIEISSDTKAEINEYITKDGYKYCFTMPTSNLILRRNNKIFVTGNSGKTYSALRIATGMAEEIEKITGKKAKILLGNTENGRGRYYANEFDYDLVDLEAPYNPELYVDFIKYAVQEGYDILILDSTSPEWEGRGGCLDLQQQAGGKYQDWSK